MNTISAIADIEVGPRHRHDLGDIAALAASIDELGLLHPVVVTRDNVLVAGERRLAACRSLGWDEVPVTIAHNLADAADLLKAERDENTCRKPMTPTEEHSIYSALLEMERVEARDRQGARTDLQPSGKFQEGSHGEAKSRAAEAATGSAGRARTLDKVGETIAVAESPKTPEPVREVAKQALKEMDATGRVDGAYRRVKQAEAQEAAPKPDPAVTGVIESDQQVQDAKYLTEFAKAMAKADDFLAFDAERIGQLSDGNEVTSVDHLVKSAQSFLDRMRRARSGLRLVNGGKA